MTAAADQHRVQVLTADFQRVTGPLGHVGHTWHDVPWLLEHGWPTDAYSRIKVCAEHGHRVGIANDPDMPLTTRLRNLIDSAYSAMVNGWTWADIAPWLLLSQSHRDLYNVVGSRIRNCSNQPPFEDWELIGPYRACGALGPLVWAAGLATTEYTPTMTAADLRPLAVLRGFHLPTDNAWLHPNTARGHGR